jgi:hypothetical protein
VWALAFYPLVLTAVMVGTTLLLRSRTGLWPRDLAHDLRLTPEEDLLAAFALVGMPSCGAVQLLMLGMAIRELRQSQPDRYTAWAAVVFGLGTILSTVFGFASQFLAWLVGD